MKKDRKNFDCLNNSLYMKAFNEDKPYFVKFAEDAKQSLEENDLYNNGIGGKRK